MAIVQKTIQLEVLVTVEVDEDKIAELGKFYDFYDVADSVCYGMQYVDEAGELFSGGVVKEYSANVISVEDTEYQYPG